MLVCPHCGSLFPEGRLSCPECGSDADTGWKSQEEIDYYSVEIPEPCDTQVEERGAGHGSLVKKTVFFLLLAWLIIFLFMLGNC